MIDETYWLLRKDSTIENKIIILENTSDEQLAWLYQYSLFTVMPSIYEGWGLPVAESLNYGKVCISSNTSSMPEIASSEIVTFVSPYNTELWLETIVSHNNPQFLDKRQKDIKRHYKQHSWEDTFKELQQLIDDIRLLSEK